MTGVKIFIIIHHVLIVLSVQHTHISVYIHICVYIVYIHTVWPGYLNVCKTVLITEPRTGIKDQSVWKNNPNISFLSVHCIKAVLFSTLKW